MKTTCGHSAENESKRVQMWRNEIINKKEKDEKNKRRKQEGKKKKTTLTHFQKVSGKNTKVKINKEMK